MRALKALAILMLWLVAWQGIIIFGDLPHYILPGPLQVGDALVQNGTMIFFHAGVTFSEIVLGLLIGGSLGIALAIGMAFSRGLDHAVRPLIIASQAIPVFTIAPLLVLWFGYGLGSKIAMTAIILFFPVTVALYDGLKSTDRDLLELSHVMIRGRDARLALLWHVQWPSAMPALATGIKLAVGVAPIGAVIGEWVGADAGLGYLMLDANRRVQAALMFACLVVLALMGIAMSAVTDFLVRRFVDWRARDPDSSGGVS